jgi:hypothetical protein
MNRMKSRRDEMSIETGERDERQLCRSEMYYLADKSLLRSYRAGIDF